MGFAESVDVRRGLPERLRDEAALLYDEAFREKFEAIVRSGEDRLRILSHSFRADLAFVAMAGDSLVGLAGFHEGGQGFTSAGGVQGVLQQLDG